MKCSVCGKEIKNKFYKVFPTQENEYYTNNNTLFICHNCVRVRTVKVFKVKQGHKLQDLEFTEYKDCETYANVLNYVQSLEVKALNLQNTLKSLKDTNDLGTVAKDYLKFMLEDKIKAIKQELKLLDKKYKRSDV